MIGSRRKKIRKTSKKNEDERAWARLPEGIPELIIGKLEDAVDLIRFRAVCKNWHVDIPKDRKIKYKHHRNLPWLCDLSWAEDSSNCLECEIYDPYSHQIFKTSKLAQGCRYTSRYYSKRVEVIGSKQGWLIGNHYHYYVKKWEIFMYNPYSQVFIPLSFTEWKPCFATFSGSRVFLFSRDKKSLYSDFTNYITSCALNEETTKEWRLEFVDTKQEESCGIQYMKEEQIILCLFKDGVMRRYSLGDGTCTQIVLGLGSHRLGRNLPLWLAKGEDDHLLVTCELGFNQQYSSFYFNWSNMSWIGGGNFKGNGSVFFSGNIATFRRTSEDPQNVKDLKVYSYENNMDWIMYSFPKPDGQNHPLYSFEYISSMSVFIEPPPIN